QVAQPGVRSVLDVVAAQRVAVEIVHVELRILGVQVVRSPRIRQQILLDVRVELAEHVELHLILEDVVSIRSEHGGAQIEVYATESEIQAAGEIRVRTSDDCPVVEVDLPVAVDVDKLDS